MAEFLFGAAIAILAIVAVGFGRILSSPSEADGVMAIQLSGTGGIALVLILVVASGRSAIIDVALILALLAAFAGLAFVLAADREGGK
jgi:multicomponent Na+:H+ antiporter subunit F